MLNKENNMPLYRQLEELIQSNIETGVWNHGQLIPSESELIKQFGVSRTTVRQALGALVSYGILKREQGRGTFVAESKFEHPLTEVTSFTRDIQRKGHKPGSITLFAEEVVPSARVATKLELKEGETVIRLERLRTVDGEPVGLHTSSLVTSLVPGLDIAELRNNDVSLYEILLSRLKVPMSEAIDTLEASVTDDCRSRLLGVPKGSPVLRVERVAYLTNGRPVEHGEMIYNAGCYKSVIRLSVRQRND